MRLKNFDKYIKEKLLGYKPAYQEDIWKAIEKKLPPSRVPNGQGSWLIVASAALVITALVPFLLKFNSIVDKNQQLSQINNEARVSNKLEPNKSVLQNVTSQSSNQSDVNQGTQTAGLTSAINLDNNNNHSLNKIAAFNLNHKALVKRSSNNYNSDLTVLENKNLKNQNSVSQELNSNELEQNSEFAYGQNNSIMNHIPILQGMIDNDVDQTIKGNPEETEVGKYADRTSNLKSTRWANWQSIFYPFWQNPAYAGSEGKVNITTDGRIDAVNNINTGSATNFHTDIAVDARLNILGGLGIGAYRNSDPTSYSLQTIFGLALSKAIINRGSTSVKIGASFTSINNSYFYNALSFPDQIVPGIGYVNATKEKNLASSTQAYGINGGIWLSNPHLMAGFDVANINTPHLEHLAEAAPLPRLWRATVGYRFTTSPDFQWLPMLMMTRQSGINQANATLTAVYKNKWMLAVAYQNINPTTGLGNISLYGGYDFNKKLRVFVSHGVNTEWALLGINEQFTNIGVKFQIL